GVGYAQMSMYWGCREGIFQFNYLADCAGAFDAIAGGQDGYAGGVITAVFEAAQAFYEDWSDVAFGDGAYYSAHRWSWFVAFVGGLIGSLLLGSWLLSPYPQPSALASCVALTPASLQLSPARGEGEMRLREVRFFR